MFANCYGVTINQHAYIPHRKPDLTVSPFSCVLVMSPRLLTQPSLRQLSPTLAVTAKDFKFGMISAWKEAISIYDSLLRFVVIKCRL